MMDPNNTPIHMMKPSVIITYWNKYMRGLIIIKEYYIGKALCFKIYLIINWTLIITPISIWKAKCILNFKKWFNRKLMLFT